jgi:esterase/lipase superfamily enzyme
MEQTIAKMAGTWLVRAGVPTLALAGVATYYSNISNNSQPPTDRPPIVAEATPDTPVAQTPHIGLPAKEANSAKTVENNPSESFATDIKDDPASSPTLLRNLPEGVKLVRIFYATDRNSTDLRSQIPWLSGVLPMCLAIAATFGIVGMGPSITRKYWPLIAIGGVVVVSYLGHSVWIRTSTLFKMSNRYGLVFGADRYQPKGKQYPLHVGYCDVTIPPTHQKGRLESPSWIHMEWKQDERKHVILQSIEPAEENAYFKNLSSRLNNSSKNEVLVFIHGYNVPFSDAVRRTAQLCNDLEFPGVPICYSWPSTATFAGYSRDEASVGWTVAHLERFLADVHSRSGAQKIHLIAHSMGNRALVGALERLVLRDKEASQYLGQVVMAAPDVDSGELSNRYIPTIVSHVQRLTLYTSQNDKALLASATLHGATRAGYQPASELLFPGVETIDVSSIDTGLLGHSYYGEHPDLIKDLQALVELNQPANLRLWLSPISVRPDQGYWAFTRKRVATQPADTQPHHRK